MGGFEIYIVRQSLDLLLCRSLIQEALQTLTNTETVTQCMHQSIKGDIHHSACTIDLNSSPIFTFTDCRSSSGANMPSNESEGCRNYHANFTRRGVWNSRLSESDWRPAYIIRRQVRSIVMKLQGSISISSEYGSDVQIVCM